MEVYKTAIISAVASFPFLALLITLPYFIHNYHKYGSISKLRIIIVYMFVLYMMCAYFLVIMPLPTRSYVMSLTTPKTQLIPGMFLVDFFKESGFVWNDIHTYLKALTSSSFYQPFFNMLLTVPFGLYLRYYHKCGWLKTLILSFLLSLFYEITQLTGIFFIYPRSYRLFDVDDLLFNTLGGGVGYLLSKIVMKFLPSRDEIDKKAIVNSVHVSGLRRIVTFIIDLFICSILGIASIIILVILDVDIEIDLFLELYCLISGIIYFIIPIIFKRGIGDALTNLGIDGKWYQRDLRLLLKYCYIFLGPVALFYLAIDHNSALLIGILYFLLLMIDGFIIVINKRIWYEKVSRTKKINTKVIEETNED